MRALTLLFCLGMSTPPTVTDPSIGPGPWTAVTQLTGGTEIRVELESGTLTGRLLNATPSALTLYISGRETTIAAKRVRRVERRPPPHRSRHAAIGLIAGLAVGGVAYLRSCNTCMSEGAAPYTAPAMGAGALIGTMLPAQHGWETVYQRPTPPVTPGWADVALFVSSAEIRIETTALWPFTAEFVTADDDTLTVRQGDRTRTYERTDTVHIERRVPGSARGQHANRGLVAGLGVGLVRAAFCGGCNAFGVSLVVVPSMAVGAIVGATRSPAKWETVYRRE